MAGVGKLAEGKEVYLVRRDSAGRLISFQMDIQAGWKGIDVDREVWVGDVLNIREKPAKNNGMP